MNLKTLFTLAAATLAAASSLTSARADIIGFGGDGTGYTLNEGQAANGAGGLSVNGDVATLTDGGYIEGNSLFYNTPQTIGDFTATFTYQNVDGRNAPGTTADGVTFTLQNDPRGAGAVGGDGGYLGYGGGPDNQIYQPAISPSAAVEFGLFSGSATGFGTNGAISLTNTSAAVLDSGDPINIILTYNHLTLTLTETLTDTLNPLNTSTFTYNVDLPTVLGGDTAYVGFTGATGGLEAVQTVSNFAFVVPEPSTWMLLGLGGAGLVVFRAKRRGGVARA